MVVALPLAGPWSWASSVCFTLAALFFDLLLLRLALTLANLFLLVAYATGFGSWADPWGAGAVSIDGLAWASLNFSLHLLGLLRLLWDERRIEFGSEDEEQVWRLFYRRGGMERLEMLQVLKRGRFKRLRAGELFMTTTTASASSSSAGSRGQSMHLIVEGLVRLDTYVPSAEQHPPPPQPQTPPPPPPPQQQQRQAELQVPTASVTLMSGDIFDLKLTNIFGIYTGFIEEPGELRTQVALTDCLLLEWSASELNEMAVDCSPVVGSYWRNVLLCSMARELRRHAHPRALLVCSRDLPEPPSVLKGGRSRDLTDPVTKQERQFGVTGSKARRFLRWLWSNLVPIWPPGLRHTAGPYTGEMARTRVLGLQQAMCRQQAPAGNSPSPQLPTQGQQMGGGHASSSSPPATASGSGSLPEAAPPPGGAMAAATELQQQQQQQQLGWPSPHAAVEMAGVGGNRDNMGGSGRSSPGGNSEYAPRHEERPLLVRHDSPGSSAERGAGSSAGGRP